MKLLVDPQYNPDLQASINSSTKLANGITCAKFLGSRGSRTQFEKLYNEGFTTRVDRKQVARNLILHANAMISAITNIEFAQHRLIVSDGIYEPAGEFVIVEEKAGGQEEARRRAQATPGASFGKGPDGWIVRVPTFQRSGYSNEWQNKRRFGQSIGYQLIDKNGKTDPRKSFDLAVYWKDYIDYDKLELAYDYFDPNGDLTTSILLTMPEVPETFEVSFNYDLETTFNSALQTKNELLEILPSN